MDSAKLKKEKSLRRHARVRAKVSGTAERPRVSVFRSLKHLYVQLIDDTTSKTLAAVHDKDLKSTEKPVAKSKALGLALAEKAKALKIEAVVFDRGSYQYHGRVQAVAEGLREGGLKL